MPDLIPIHWIPRTIPLAPVAVAGFGVVAKALGNRFLQRSDEELSQLQGAVNKDLILLVSDNGELLPWADGAVYLGRDNQAPALLLPTIAMPNVPLPLFERALLRQFGNLAPPIAVLSGEQTIVPLGGRTLPVERALLKKWLGALQ